MIELRTFCFTHQTASEALSYVQPCASKELFSKLGASGYTLFLFLYYCTVTHVLPITLARIINSLKTNSNKNYQVLGKSKSFIYFIMDLDISLINYIEPLPATNFWQTLKFQTMWLDGNQASRTNGIFGSFNHEICKKEHRLAFV